MSPASKPKRSSGSSSAAKKGQAKSGNSKPRYSALQGVGRAMSILEAIAERPMRAQELANALGLRWTTAYRTLAHLEGAGYLRRDPRTHEYLIGARLYSLGVSYLATHPLVQQAHGQLEAVAAELKCAAQVNERDQRTVVTLEVADGPFPVAKTSPGFKFPLGVAAKGQLLLAFAPEEVQAEILSKPLPQYTARTITDPGQLAARLEEIRSAERALTRDDLQVGVGSVAAPIRDAAGEVVACMSLIVRSRRLSNTRDQEELLAAAGKGARALSLGLGWQPSTTSA